MQERQIRTHVGYDRRDQPGGGAHGMEIEYILRRNETLAISWRFNTGWVPRPLDGPYVDKALRRSKPGVDRELVNIFPTGHQVRLHSSRQLKDWWMGPDDCNVIEGTCYSDAGYVLSDEVLEILIEKGDDAVFARLDEILTSWVEEGD